MIGLPGGSSSAATTPAQRRQRDQVARVAVEQAASMIFPVYPTVGRRTVALVATCSAMWESDRSRYCQAEAVAEGLCLAHYGHGTQLLADIAAEHGVVDLARCEVTAATWEAVTSLLEPTPPAVWAPGATFLGPVTTLAALGECQFEGATFRQPVALGVVAGPARFHGAAFHSDASFAQFRFAAGFAAAVFHRSARFGAGTDPAADVDTRAFLGPAIFDDATFAREAVFTHAQFPPGTSFARARFGANADFSKATFTSSPEDAVFAGAAFARGALFGWTTWVLDDDDPDMVADLFPGVEFHGPVSFQPVTFHRPPPSFSRAEFRDFADFADVTHVEVWRFKETTLGPHAQFARFRELNPDTKTSAEVDLDGVVWAQPSSLSIRGVSVTLNGCALQQPLAVDGDDSGSSLAGIRDCTVTAPVTITCPVTSTSFRGSTGLELLRFRSRREGRQWQTTGPPWRRQRVIAHAAELPPREAQAIYRQLRAGLEVSKAAPEAADFYIGELDARRRTPGLWWVDRVLLRLYRSVGGYGVRAGPPAGWLASVIVVTALLFRYRTAWFVRGPGTVVDGFDVTHFWDALAFVLRSSVSLFTAPTTGLTPGGTIVLVLERYISVSLLALAVFALRSRVAR
jgi:Pentapeptide repeats (9 copies)